MSSRPPPPIPSRKGRGRSLIPLLLTFLLLPACTPSGPAPHPHYVLGRPYQSGGIWWYPQDTQNLDETGLAAVYPDDRPALTTDGEAFSQDALAIAQPTVPLPAIARLTDLQTGRSLLVRINDRGTPTPRRLVQVTRRVAALLGMPRDGVAEVRLTLLVPQTQAAASNAAGAPRLAIAAAPRGVVQSATLPPPPGVGQEHRRSAVAVRPVAAQATDPAAATLDGRVTQQAPHPGYLWVRLDTFQSYQYAAMQRARVGRLSPRIVPVPGGQTENFRVVVGPFTNVAAADAALDQAIAAGVSDARIVVE